MILRLFGLKQRTLPWKFEIAHMPGKTNVAGATSRHPISEYAEIASLSLMSPADQLEYASNAAIVKHTEEFFTIS